MSDMPNVTLGADPETFPPDSLNADPDDYVR